MIKIFTATLLVVMLTIVGCSSDQAVKTQQPHIHFSLNDSRLKSPNELLFHEGEYHLFYQRLQDSTMQWGHATSSDLIQWKDLPPVLQSYSPMTLGAGSVIVDWDNISGFGKSNSPMLAYYIISNKVDNEQRQNRQTISLAYSNDQGTTWETSKRILTVGQTSEIGVKDIKVFWHEKTQRWIMLVLSGLDLRFYSSVDLFEWDYENMFEPYRDLVKGDGVYIDFFPVEVEESNEQKWVLLVSVDAGSPNSGSGIKYFIGDYDGYTFKQNGKQSKWLDNGSDNYAGVCLSNYQDFGKPLFYLGWLSNSRYQDKNDYRETAQSYTLPRKLSLIKRYGDYYIASMPIQCTENKKKLIAGGAFSGELILKGNYESPWEINLKFDVRNKLHFEFPEVFGVQISNENNHKLTIGYHSRRHYFFISEQDAGSGINNLSYCQYLIDRPTMDIKIIIDNSSIEMFAVDGIIVLTQKSFSPKPWKRIALFSERGNANLLEGSLIDLGNMQN